MKKNKKYRITLNEVQIGLVQKSLEEYFRLRMGQCADFVDDMASLAFDLSPENPDHGRIFDKFLLTRDHIAEMMSAVFKVVFGVYGCPPCEKTEDVLVAQDLWDVIRVSRGLSRWGTALHTSNEPLPDIEVLDGKE